MKLIDIANVYVSPCNLIEEEIRSLNTNKLIADLVTKQNEKIAKYPKNSITKREVVSTISISESVMDDNEKFKELANQINQSVTDSIFANVQKWLDDNNIDPSKVDVNVFNTINKS